MLLLRRGATDEDPTAHIIAWLLSGGDSSGAKQILKPVPVTEWSVSQISDVVCTPSGPVVPE